MGPWSRPSFYSLVEDRREHVETIYCRLVTAVVLLLLAYFFGYGGARESGDDNIEGVGKEDENEGRHVDPKLPYVVHIKKTIWTYMS